MAAMNKRTTLIFGLIITVLALLPKLLSFALLEGIFNSSELDEGVGIGEEEAAEPSA